MSSVKDENDRTSSKSKNEKEWAMSLVSKIKDEKEYVVSRVGGKFGNHVIGKNFSISSALTITSMMTPPAPCGILPL